MGKRIGKNEKEDRKEGERRQERRRKETEKLRPNMVMEIRKHLVLDWKTVLY